MAAVNWKSMVKAAEDTKPGVSPRERFIGNLKKQVELFKDPKAEGKRNFEKQGDQVVFTARMGNMTVELLPGKRAVSIAAKDFPAVVEAIIGDVEKGEFDKQVDAIAANYSKRRKPA